MNKATGRFLENFPEKWHILVNSIAKSLAREVREITVFVLVYDVFVEGLALLIVA